MKKESALRNSVTRLIVPTLLLCLSFNGFSQKNEIIVTGKISSDSAVLKSATVQLKGDTKRAVNTDQNGNYAITVPASGALLFSMVGYAQQELPINGRSTINVLMKPANN